MHLLALEMNPAWAAWEKEEVRRRRRRRRKGGGVGEGEERGSRGGVGKGKEERKRKEENKLINCFLAINTCSQRRDMNFRTSQVSFGHKFF